MIGNPLHKAGLACNVDNKGGTTTKNVNGIQLLVGQPVPDNWISKTIDICIFVSIWRASRSINGLWKLTHTCFIA